MAVNIPEDILGELGLLDEYSKNTTVYTDDPTGIIASERITRPDKKFWKKPGVKSDFIKKPLIITDWSLSITSSPYQIRPDRDFLGELLELGHPVFICQHGKLLKIASKVELEQAVKTLRPIHPEKVKEAVEAYNKEQVAKTQPTLGNVEIIDYYRSRELVAGLQKYPELHGFHKWDLDLKPLYLQTGILDSEYFPLMPEDFFREVLQSLQGHPKISLSWVLDHLKESSPSEDQVNIFLDALAGKIKNLTVAFGAEDIPLVGKEKALENLESLCIAGENSYYILSRLILYLTQLKQLSFDKFPDSLPKDALLPKLTALTITEPIDHITQLISFLKICPALKELTFTKKIKNSESLKPEDLPRNLEKLVLNNFTHATPLAEIWPNLNHLELHESNEITTGVLLKLRSLKLNKSNLGGFIAILNQCPQLEEVELEDMELSDPEFLKGLKSHSNLKKLKIKDGKKIDFKVLFALTEKFPALNQLEIVKCDFSYQKDLPDFSKQLQLKKLILNRGTHDSELVPLTLVYRHLECIYFTPMSIGGFRKLAPLPHLKELYHLSNDAFSETLLDSPLEKLALNNTYTRNLWDESSSSSHKFNQLQQLRVSNLDDNSFGFLENNQNLTELVIENSSYLRFEKEQKQLLDVLAKIPSLKRIVLSRLSLKNQTVSLDDIVEKIVKIGNCFALEWSMQSFVVPPHYISATIIPSQGSKKLSYLHFKDDFFDTTSPLLKNNKTLQEIETFVLTCRELMPVPSTAFNLCMERLAKVQRVILNHLVFEPEHKFVLPASKSLTDISFFDCGINGTQLLSLLDNFKDLKFLLIANCSAITAEDIFHLQRRYPQLKIDYRESVEDEEDFLGLEPAVENKDDNGPKKKKPKEFKLPLSPFDLKNDVYDPKNKAPSNIPILVANFYGPDKTGVSHVRDYRANIANDYEVTPNGIKYGWVEPKVEVLKNLKITPDLKKFFDEEKNFHSEQKIEDGTKETKTEASHSFTRYGQGQFVLTHKWQRLPGLSPNDQLLGFEASLKMPFLEVGYCEATRCHYVRLSELLKDGQQTVDIAVIKKAITHPYDASSGKIPSKLEFELDAKNRVVLKKPKLKDFVVADLVAFCRQGKFSGKHFSFNLKKSSKPTLEEQQIQGLIARLCDRASCEDRSMLFLLIAKACNFAFNINVNQIHAFPEIHEDGRIRRADLGGIPATLDITPAPQTKIVSQRPELTAGAAPKDLGYFKKLPFSKSIAELESKSYCDEVWATLCKTDRRNLLLHANSAAQILQFKTAMAKTLKEQGCRHFYLADFDSFSKTDVRPRDNQDPEEIKSELVNFLTQAKAGDVLFVDWSDYQPQHLGFNTVVDDVRHIKGVKIPDGVIVVSVLEKGKAKTLQDDFHRRFRYIDDLPSKLVFPTDIYNNRCTSVESKIESKAEAKLDEKIPSAELYDAENWEKELLGHVKVSDKFIKFTPGPLLLALQAKQTSLTLVNAPWHLKAFQIFMSEFLLKNKFTYYGTTYDIPENFVIRRTERPYTLANECKIEHLQEKNNSTWTHTLNIHTFEKFLEGFHIEDGGVHTHEGWFKKSSEPLIILVTETLSKIQWVQICAKIKSLKLPIRFIVAAGVTLPSELGLSIEPSFTPWRIPLESKSDKPLAIYPSNDVDAKTKRLCTEQKIVHVISVGPNTSYQDVIDPVLIDKDAKGERVYKTPISSVIDQLRKGQTVILKGKFSAQLLANLETLLAAKPYLWVNGQQEFVTKGQLILVTDEKEIFPFVQKPKYEIFEPQKLQKPLTQEIKTESKAEVKAEIKTEAKTSDEAEARAIELAYLIKNNPGTVIWGDTGTGKSYTLFEDLPRIYKQLFCKDLTLYAGLEQLLAWAQGSGGVLVLDEANLLEEDLSCLEGLWNEPPGILIKGQFYPLSSEHRLALAGNQPGNYEGRRYHRIFNYCAHTTFSHLSLQTLHNKTAAVLAQAVPDFNSEVVNKITAVFIEVYKICKDAVNGTQNTLPPPLTLRNLQNIALRFAIFLRRYQDKDLNMNHENLAWFAAYEQIRHLFGKDLKKNIKEQILKHIPGYKQYKADLNKRCQQEKSEAKSIFKVTKKRKTPFRLLIDQVAIRELRVEKKITTAGTRGIMLVGEPGNGKSSLVVDSLRNLKYQDVTAEIMKQAEVQDHVVSETPEIKKETTGISEIKDSADAKITAPKKYVHLTPVDAAEFLKILHLSFHYGYVLVIDEINSMMEHALNHYLSGRDLEAKKPQQEGFFLIGTKNYGRQAFSAAQKNRIDEYNIANYEDDDLREILPEEKQIQTAINGYRIAQNTARYGIGLMPTPSDLKKDWPVFQKIAEQSQTQSSRLEIKVG